MYIESTGVISVFTRTRHSLDVETVKTLRAAKNGQSWRFLSESLGYPPSYAGTLQKAHNAEDGVMTLQAENILRAKLGLHARSTYEVTACPDCGSVHTGRCHNKPIADVVVLAEGERIIKRARKPRTYPKCHRPRMTDEEYTEYLQWRAQRKGQP